MVYLLALTAVSAAAVAQLLLKKGLLVIGQLPHSLGDLGPFFTKAFTNPYVLSAIFLTLIAALIWMVAVSRTELSYIYPFMALSFVLVALFSWLFFNEGVTALRWVGIAMICIGVVLVARS